ncbi:putative PUA RNA binding domain protein [Chaetomium fimeti]|uniref:PUA RNA binding domain protein n=1 Tax=Chaetomium fimeti TaxID=1854472 RepID=A0AAE0HAR7_9PEZI|nr:putative PUA RNA binding domain protein [Chaetomium fimeti]
MPLVVPGVTADNVSADEAQVWLSKLAGKTLTEGPSTETTFCKTELPQQTRVIEPGMMVTKDYQPDRLNVQVKEDGTVSHVYHVSSLSPPPKTLLHVAHANKPPPPLKQPTNPSHLSLGQQSLHGSPKQKLKSSIQRSIRQSILTTYPLLTPHIDEVLPKKHSLEQIKLPDRAALFVIDGHPIVYQQDNNANRVLLPHLRLVHRFPQCFPTVRIDRGAIRFVLSGATLMAPGLTSKGGRLPIPEGGDGDGDEEEGEEGVKVPNEGPDEDGHWSRELEKGEPVVIMAEGKEEAAAVGILVMGTKDIKEKGKGPVMEEAHYLGDGLWGLSVE